MIEKKLKTPIALTIVAGVFMKMFDNPYGPLVFTIGFGAYFILKIVKLSRTKKWEWTNLHTLQLFLIFVAFAALILLYLDYPYARVAFILALLFESLVNAKLMIASYIGKENFRTIIGFLGKLLRR